MSIRWYAGVVLALWYISIIVNTEELQITKPKEVLRHQQTHRPSFIDRRLTQDTKQLQIEVEKQQEAITIVQPETSIEKPQIRHGRSRGHFSRIKSTKEPSHVQTYSEGAQVGKVTPQDNGLSMDPIRQKLSRFANDTLTDFDFESSTMTNMTFNNSTLPRETYIQSRKYGQVVEQFNGTRATDYLRKLRKVGASSGDRVSKRNRNISRHDSYGIVNHEQVDDDRYTFDDMFAKFETEEYDYEDEVMKKSNTSDGGVDYRDASITIDSTKRDKTSVPDDVVSRFLRIIENQHLLGENCTAGTDLNLGEGVVDQYAQERFRLEANLAVNRANMLTRLWKYAPSVMVSSEYLLHASVLSMVEFDEDIFAAGNCYDKMQYKERWLYCPFAHRLQDQDGVLVKDLAVEYKYLTNSSEWFFIARKNAERVIANNNQFSRGYHTYTLNDTFHTDRIEDEILTVKYEDGRWSKPYYDCGGGNIWMLTYTVPFFGYANDSYFFKGTSGIDIDLRRVDIDQCPVPLGSSAINIFAASDKCKKRTTECIAIPGLGFRRGSYRCVCKRGFYYPDTKSLERYYNGTVIEEEFEKLMVGEESQYSLDGIFECLPCAEGCESCEDGSPCVVSLNWLMRTAILILECCVIACLPAVILFTWKFGNVKVVKAASPVLLRVILLGAFFIYCTTIVMYPRPNVVTCTVRVWFREIGFSLTYGALMLKTWRISVIFRVRSAKAVKITDMNLLKRLGIIVTIFTVFLGIRTVVAPPVVIVGRTADDLKAYLCQTDWWDHSFTTLEVMFLVWGIRLCIVVRKAPSEFNESRFISMAIYNEFLLSVFLNVSMLFLQSPANPDLLYIIFFCHTQLTVTLLLCLIFGSKAYVVFRGGGKDDAIGKLPGTTGKFIGKTCRAQKASNQTHSISLQQANFTEEGDGIMEEFRRLYAQLEILKEKNMRMGNRHLTAKILAMQEAANRAETQISTIQAISSTLRLNDISVTTVEESTLLFKSGSESGVESYREAEARNGKSKKLLCQKSTDKDNSQGSDDVPSTSKDKDIAEICNEKTTKNVDENQQNTSDCDIKKTTSDSSELHVATDNGEVVAEIDTEENDDVEVNKSTPPTLPTLPIVINLEDNSRYSEEVIV
ncbi:metabotropic glycine receptor-like [Diachasmimorpha longicaudata]|uniref:metabotropic glycine receptor-like n=1 Tax=Diachasmimorpha longicaudata TaxID=58733 RepID=UPI0030B88D93